MTSFSSSASSLRSLFLPTRADERVAFASVCPLYTDFTKSSAGVSVTSSQVPDESSPISGVPGSSTSLAFSLLYARPRAVVAVLRSREVVWYSLEDPQRLREVRRIRPLPVISQSQRKHPHRRVKGGLLKKEPTSFSLIPLEISLLDPLIADGNAKEEEASAEPSQQGSHTGAGARLLRGVIGGSDGRVSVFSESGYVFSFAAHCSPVTAAHAVTSHTRTASTLFAADADSQAPGDGTEDGEPRHAAISPGRTFSEAPLSLGFVTCGRDGSVYVWRQGCGVFKPTRLLEEKALFTRSSAFTVYSPSAANYVLSPAAGWFSEALPSAVLLHATTASLDIRNLSQPPEEAPHLSFALPPSPPPSLLVRQGHVRASLQMLLTNDGGTSAVGTNGTYALVARDFSIYRVDLHAAPLPADSGEATHHIMASPYLVTEIVLKDEVALLSAGPAGVVHLISPTLPAAVLLLSYHSYHHRPLRHVSFCEELALMVLVDSAGSTELICYPETVVNAVAARTFATLQSSSHSLAELLPSVRLLRSRCAFDGVATRESRSRQVQSEELSVIIAARSSSRLPAPVRGVISKLMGRRRWKKGAAGSGTVSNPVSSAAGGQTSLSLRRCREAMLVARISLPPRPYAKEAPPPSPPATAEAVEEGGRDKVN